MRDTRKSAVTLAGAGALAVLLATSAFAQNTPHDAQSRGSNGHQRAAASNDSARNQQRQAAPQAQQFRQNAQQPQQQAAQFQQSTRQAQQPAAAQFRQSTRQVQQPVAQFRQNAPQVQQAEIRNSSQAGRNGNWNGGARESARVVAPSQSFRNNERVNLSGRVTSFTHESGGYRVHLDRDSRSFWIPEARFRNGNGLRVGLSLSLGGIFNGGLIDVDAINYPGSYGYAAVPVYDQGYITGVVDRIDYRTNTILVRDEASGRFINVDMRTAGRTSGVDARNVQPGDYLTLTGQWDRGGVFEAFRVDNVSPRAY
jgi:hypothetical protein